MLSSLFLEQLIWWWWIQTFNKLLELWNQTDALSSQKKMRQINCAARLQHARWKISCWERSRENSFTQQNECFTHRRQCYELRLTMIPLCVIVKSVHPGFSCAAVAPRKEIIVIVDDPTADSGWKLLSSCHTQPPVANQVLRKNIKRSSQLDVTNI